MEDDYNNNQDEGPKGYNEDEIRNMVHTYNEYAASFDMNQTEENYIANENVNPINIPIYSEDNSRKEMGQIPEFKRSSQMINQNNIQNLFTSDQNFNKTSNQFLNYPYILLPFPNIYNQIPLMNAIPALGLYNGQNLIYPLNNYPYLNSIYPYNIQNNLFQKQQDSQKRMNCENYQNNNNNAYSSFYPKNQNDNINSKTSITLNKISPNNISNKYQSNNSFVNMKTFSEQQNLNYTRIPDIKQRILKKIKESNITLNKEENEILNGDKYDKHQIVYHNSYMFYSKDTISLYAPHILKGKNNIISILLPEKEKLLKLSDFHYTYSHDKIIGDILFETLKQRINEYNNLQKKDGIIIDSKYNDKIFGFNEALKNPNYYLYSIVDKNLVKKIKENNMIKLKNNLIDCLSQIDQKSLSINSNIIFNSNMEYLKRLTYEELILNLVLNRLDNKYEIYPNIIFYEFLKTIDGKNVKLYDRQLSGYEKLGYVIYSQCDYQYDEDENPLIIQESHESPSLWFKKKEI